MSFILGALYDLWLLSENNMSIVPLFTFVKFMTVIVCSFCLFFAPACKTLFSARVVTEYVAVTNKRYNMPIFCLYLVIGLNQIGIFAFINLLVVAN